MKLDAIFTPTEFEALTRRDLSNTLCVVFDVLRATSTMVTALANGALAVVPVATISDALALRQQTPTVLLGGERHGLRIMAAEAGIDFDLGNSPREYTAARVAGHTVVMTTTNGTRALRSCASAREVLLGTFLNLEATAERVVQAAPAETLLIGSGTFEEAAYEDVLGAGALCKRLWPITSPDQCSDSALIARKLFELEQPHLAQGIAAARNARRLLSRPDLRDDVPFCLRMNIHNFTARMDADGMIAKGRSAPPAALRRPS